jgi:hypothetical protein
MFALMGCVNALKQGEKGEKPPEFCQLLLFVSGFLAFGAYIGTLVLLGLVTAADGHAENCEEGVFVAMLVLYALLVFTGAVVLMAAIASTDKQARQKTLCAVSAVLCVAAVGIVIGALTSCLDLLSNATSNGTDGSSSGSRGGGGGDDGSSVGGAACVVGVDALSQWCVGSNATVDCAADCGGGADVAARVASFTNYPCVFITYLRVPVRATGCRARYFACHCRYGQAGGPLTCLCVCDWVGLHSRGRVGERVSGG